MNGRFIYLLVALLTFGIGSFIALNFYGKGQNEPRNIENPEIKQPDFSSKIKPVKSYSIKEYEQIFSAASPKKEVPQNPFCRDTKILPIWNQLINDKTFKDWEADSRDSLDCSEMLDVKQLDLNRDGQKEILLRGKNSNLCSPVGNCAFWIYSKNGKKYRKLIHSTDFWEITKMGNQVRKSKTKGYFDILLKGHMSASDTNYDFYKFDGKKIQTHQMFSRNACYRNK